MLTMALLTSVISLHTASENVLNLKSREDSVSLVAPRGAECRFGLRIAVCDPRCL